MGEAGKDTRTGGRKEGRMLGLGQGRDIRQGWGKAGIHARAGVRE